MYGMVASMCLYQITKISSVCAYDLILTHKWEVQTHTKIHRHHAYGVVQFISGHPRCALSPSHSTLSLFGREMSKLLHVSLFIFISFARMNRKRMFFVYSHVVVLVMVMMELSFKSEWDIYDILLSTHNKNSMWHSLTRHLSLCSLFE
jgi:hypothetical protein